MYQAFQKVLDIVLSEAKGKDGKMINKRFIDRINELIGEDDNLKYELLMDLYEEVVSELLDSNRIN